MPPDESGLNRFLNIYQEEIFVVGDPLKSLEQDGLNSGTGNLILLAITYEMRDVVAYACVFYWQFIII